MEITKKLAANWKALSPFERNQFDNQSKVKNLSNTTGLPPFSTLVNNSVDYPHIHSNSESPRDL